MSTPRTTLTKSLHTVTAVSRLAAYLYEGNVGGHKVAVDVALTILGLSTHWAEEDPTYVACREATKRLLA